MKALSIRAPWWWLILHAGKDIENRDWPTGFRGTIFVHASKWFKTEEVIDDWDYSSSLIDFSELSASPMPLGRMKDFGGHIVGKVDIVDCVRRSSSPWFMGEYGFVLRNPVSLEHPFPLRGALGLFNVDDSRGTQ